jgi:mono/diheme cytochrome c family protein
MKNWLRRTLWTLAAVIALAAALLALGLALAYQRAQRQVPAHVVAVSAATDAAALAQGRYLFETRGCASCHGADGLGRLFIDSGALRVAAPAIARGAGSATVAYRPQDWDRAVRHGLKPDERPLMFMPSQDFNRLSDADLGALVGYVQSLPAGAGRERVLELPLLGRVLYGYGRIPDAAMRIDHALPPAPPVAVAASVDHGRYVAQICIGCHRSDFSGGPVPGGPPGWPPATDLRPLPGGAMARYTDAAALARMIASGRSADGRTLRVMPFESLRALSPLDLEALHRYLRSLPSGPSGS